MMPRNFSRAASSSFAGPCSVSMKPSTEASGVRNSWLALATKSACARATLTRTDRQGNVTTLSTVQMDGIESVRYWDGVARKPFGLALYSAPASPVAGFNAVA